jgi:hypothetical protein
MLRAVESGNNIQLYVPPGRQFEVEPWLLLTQQILVCGCPPGYYSRTDVRNQVADSLSTGGSCTLERFCHLIIK